MYVGSEGFFLTSQISHMLSRFEKRDLSVLNLEVKFLSTVFSQRKFYSNNNQLCYSTFQMLFNYQSHRRSYETDQYISNDLFSFGGENQRKKNSTQLYFLNMLYITDELLLPFLTEHQRQNIDKILHVIHHQHDRIDKMPWKEVIFELYEDQDDYMIDSMIILFKIFKKISSEMESNDSYFRSCAYAKSVLHFLFEIEPNKMFSRFLASISYDHTIILDFLISNETLFLEYFIMYLNYLIQGWDEFSQSLTVQPKSASSINLTDPDELESLVEQMGNISLVVDEPEESEHDKIMETLIPLALSVERAMEKDLFPYNATQLLKKLNFIENIYEEIGLSAEINF
eukprot:TRINITY_DN7114_c0_g1_i4.p1 TRINITY_DN7114_c0_g1~~TRINITY_DN7114_c0_g1_i4.p1  ORF type:complete len:342 (-),score=37.67 TRINITY_DN7114_c0_g1_i4:7-1032(-)